MSGVKPIATLATIKQPSVISKTFIGDIKAAIDFYHYQVVACLLNAAINGPNRVMSWLS
jgi:hypothetical protein